MAQKLEKWQFPVGKKSEKGDKEFIGGISDTLDSIDFYEKKKKRVSFKAGKI